MTVVSKFILDKESIFAELFSFSLLMMCGLAGIIPFLGGEFLGISYEHSSLELLVIIVIIATLAYFFTRKHINKIKYFEKNRIVDLIIFLPVIFILVRGYLLPMRGWDAYSLYDSRARIFLNGTKLSEMSAFSKYDEFNQLYYFSYPPMTSVLHAFFYSVGISEIMLLYAIFYSVFIIYIYLFIKDTKLNSITKFAIFVISAFNPLIFEHTKLAYSNLPTIAYQVAALYYLFKYVKNKNNNFIIISSVFLSFSIWTRSLEPLFISFFVAVIYAIYIQKTTKITKISLFVKYVLISMSTWLIWHYYIKYTIGNLGETSPTVFGLLYKIYNSLTLSNLLDVLFFIYDALFPIIYYIILIIVVIVLYILKGLSSMKTVEKLIILIILTTEIMMFGGTLYFSSTFTWWSQIPDSFLRSNLILIPLAGVLCANVLENMSMPTRK